MTKTLTIFRNQRYILAWEEGIPHIIIDGRKYKLTCHPYEPCLYITDADGHLTAVHNAFDPDVVLEAFQSGKTVTSITGMEYDALDFCRMVEYAAGRLDIGIDDAERVFGARPKMKQLPEKNPLRDVLSDKGGILRPESGDVIEEDPFLDLIEDYPDSVIDFCLVKSIPVGTGRHAHRMALAKACRKLFVERSGEVIWHYEVEKADAEPVSPETLFAPARENGPLNYRKAFLDPPYPNGYTDADFDRINAALFPRGTAELTVFQWTTGWSEYFDEGHEWWGTLCLTVYDKALDRFVVILASATD